MTSGNDHVSFLTPQTIALNCQYNGTELTSSTLSAPVYPSATSRNLFCESFKEWTLKVLTNSGFEILGC